MKDLWRLKSHIAYMGLWCWDRHESLMLLVGEYITRGS